MGFEYECAMSGLTAEGQIHEEADGLDDLPVGWTCIRITRRVYNPEWVMLQQLKEGMVTQLLQQVPPEQMDLMRDPLNFQVDAQFHAKEKDTPVFLPDTDDLVYLSPGADVTEALNEVREQLGLGVMPALHVPALEDAELDDDDDDVEDPEEYEEGE